MPTTRGLDSDGDWTFGQGLSSYKKNDEAIKQNIQTRILEWVGDCFFAADAGIDWKTRLSDKGQAALLESDIKSLILKSDGVVDLQSLAVSLIDRVFNATFVIRTVYSPSVQATIIQQGVANG